MALVSVNIVSSVISKVIVVFVLGSLNFFIMVIRYYVPFVLIMVECCSLKENPTCLATV